MAPAIGSLATASQMARRKCSGDSTVLTNCSSPCEVNRNDDVLGFFHDWIKEFSVHCEQVTVICLEKGEYDLPANVRVLSLGKEEGRSRLKYLYRLYKYIFQERKKYDTVFVHMNPEYIILGGLIWKLLGKRMSLWYAHGHPSLGLKIAEKITHDIFSSVPFACRLDSPKVHFIGQGIDTEKIVPVENKNKGNPFKLISIGRISPSKDYETLIEAVVELQNRGVAVEATIVGSIGLSSQQEYYEKLKALVEKNHFIGSVPNHQITKQLQASDMFVSMTHTGSLDKAVLEAMAAGIPIVTCGEAFEEVLGAFAKECMFEKKNKTQLADRIEVFAKMDVVKLQEFGKRLRDIIVRDHSLRGFVQKIIGFYECPRNTHE